LNPIDQLAGGIVVRRVEDGSTVAVYDVYDVYGVTGLSIAPDSRTFVYATGAGTVQRALVRLPAD
jgi:hypothetical protein